MAGAASNVKVLLVCANPRGTDPIRTAEEDRTLRESVQLSPFRDSVNIETLHAATIDDLRRRLLRQHFDIVHFSGHGTHTGLAFEGQGSRLMVPSSEALAELLKRHSVPAVILNACYSLSVGRLVGLGVSFTVASPGPIADPAAIEFTRGFYDAIGAGRNVPDAYEEGMSCAKLKGYNPSIILLREGEEYSAPKSDDKIVPEQIQRAADGQLNVLSGFVLDTSGSMRENIRNDSGRLLSRLESVQLALASVSRSLRGRFASASFSGEFRAFVYAFGLRANNGVGDLISVVRAADQLDLAAEVERRRIRYEAEARRTASPYSDLLSLARSVGFGGLVDGATEAAREHVTEKIANEVVGLLLRRASEIGDSTATVEELAQIWKAESTGPNFKDIEPLIYGATPMRAAAIEIAARFKRTERSQNGHEQRFLFVVSDGEPTDGDPRDAFSEIRNGGVDIVSCFVTGLDIADPRVLWASPQEGWSDGARLMFDIAATIDDRGPFARCLMSRGWELEPGAKLFVQVNHSTVLEEFISIAESIASEASGDFLPEGR